MREINKRVLFLNTRLDWRSRESALLTPFSPRQVDGWGQREIIILVVGDG
jgi:hypothetical protein